MSAELAIKWANEDSTAYKLNADNLHEIHPAINSLYRQFLQAGDTGNRYLQIMEDTAIKIINGGTHKVFQSGSSAIEISAESNLDTGTTLTAGTDYYVYVCDETDGTASIVVSLNSTYPDGYSGDSSRKVGGFHTLCADVGTIADHSLSGYLAGDILPASIWCLTHRPECEPEGMVWSDDAKIWVDIYMLSGTGDTTASVYGATITDTRDWMDFTDDLGAVGKQMLACPEFQIVAAGSNEATNIAGSADPGTTGGHLDTAGRRMVSDGGLEDCCGALWQWLKTHASGDIKLLAGGGWSHGASCGSRYRSAANSRGDTYATFGSRGCARSRA